MRRGAPDALERLGGKRRAEGGRDWRWRGEIGEVDFAAGWRRKGRLAWSRGKWRRKVFSGFREMLLLPEAVYFILETCDFVGDKDVSLALKDRCKRAINKIINL